MDESRFRAGVQMARMVGAMVKSRICGRPEDFFAEDYLSNLSRAQQQEQLALLLHHSGEQKAAWNGVSLIAQRLLRNGAPLPRQLAEWVADRLEGKKQPPPGGAYANTGRNQAVVLAVQQLVDDGFHATRRGAKGGRAGDAHSACDAVALAFGLNYKNVERIWNASARSSSATSRDLLERLPASYGSPAKK